MGTAFTTPNFALDHWPTERLRAVANAYREAQARLMDPGDVREAAILTFMAHGGSRQEAERDVMHMIITVQREHGAWLERPIRERMELREEAMRTLGWWPPPIGLEKSRIWGEVAVERLSAPPPDDAEVDRRIEARDAENFAWLEARRVQVLGPSMASGSPESETPQRS